MPNQDRIAGRVAPYGALSTQSLSEYLATLGLFLTLCIAAMFTFVCVRVIEAFFPGTPQPAYWLLGICVFVAAYFAYGQIKLAPLLTPLLFVAMLWLCREVATRPASISHSRSQTNHSAQKHAH